MGCPAALLMSCMGLLPGGTGGNAARWEAGAKGGSWTAPQAGVGCRRACVSGEQGGLDAGWWRRQCVRCALLSEHLLHQLDDVCWGHHAVRVACGRSRVVCGDHGGCLDSTEDRRGCRSIGDCWGCGNVGGRRSVRSSGNLRGPRDGGCSSGSRGCPRSCGTARGSGNQWGCRGCHIRCCPEVSCVGHNVTR